MTAVFGDLRDEFPETAVMILEPTPTRICLGADSAEAPVLVGDVLVPVIETRDDGAISDAPPTAKNS